MSDKPQLVRAFEPELELQRGGEGRTLVGLAVPFDVPAPVVDFGIPYEEVFRPGAFTKTINERASKVKLLLMHDSSKLPLGVAQELREDARGLYSELRVSKTNAGDEIIELVRDGALDALSIGFRPIRPGPKARIMPGDTVERHEVALNEISIVSQAAYADARIMAMRALEEQAQQVERATPRLDAARRRVAGL